jgi:SAM-dependent methyltransferase
VPEEFDSTFWEERYRGRAAARAGKPNPQLVTEIGDLPPGTALDAGCGEGADAIWLASRGWQVTAADISITALRNAREQADELGSDVTDRITWMEIDLTDRAPDEERFDLVSTHYVHPVGSRDALFRRLAAAVAPGGTLLVVGHDPSDRSTGHSDTPGVHFTAQEAAALLDPGRWEVAVAETRTRNATGHGGREVTLRDSVLRARRRP